MHARPAQPPRSLYWTDADIAQRLFFLLISLLSCKLCLLGSTKLLLSQCCRSFSVLKHSTGYHSTNECVVIVMQEGWQEKQLLAQRLLVLYCRLIIIQHMALIIFILIHLLGKVHNGVWLITILHFLYILTVCTLHSKMWSWVENLRLSHFPQCSKEMQRKATSAKWEHNCVYGKSYTNNNCKTVY